jgi:phenylalanyl-tRNA synthetase alpha chain
MATLIDTIHSISEQFKKELKAIQTLSHLEEFRILYLGRNGKIAQLMPALKKLSLEEKRTIGPLLHELKETTAKAFDIKKQQLELHEIEQELDSARFFDITLEQPNCTTGTLHPLTLTTNIIRNIFLSMGYDIIEGKQTETEFYNFDALNIPQDHPARDLEDTFFLDVPGMLLRTHTSTVQIHAMQSKQLPIAIAAIGRVFRHESTDATHDIVFNQAEGLVVDTNISLADLLGTIEQFFRSFFNRKDLTIRVRPSYFPFVEPGLEVDISCPFCSAGCSICKYSRWIEMGGAGLVHPHVLQAGGIDANTYSGFAFGLGIERLTMSKYGIPDVRLFSGGNLSFLNQF